MKNCFKDWSQPNIAAPSGARGLNACLGFYLHTNFVYASSKCSCESAFLCKLHEARIFIRLFTFFFRFRVVGTK